MATEKDKLTNALMAVAVGLLFLLFRDYINLIFESIEVWIGTWVKGRMHPGAGVFELLVRLVVVLFLGIVGLICLGILWVFSGLNQIYVLPVLAMLIAYATPWPFKLGFLNPKPYIIRGCQWAYHLLILSTYGEYVRRGRGKNVVFVVLPLVGLVAVAAGVVGVVMQSPDGFGWRFPALDGIPSVMPRVRVLIVDQSVETNLKAGIKIYKVMVSSKDTRLVFRFWSIGPPYARLQLSNNAALSWDSYLVDDHGKRYSVIGSEDMEIGRGYWVDYEHDHEGTLIFEPLREDTQYFDLHFHSLETNTFWLAKQVKVQ
jgi:hypothetical protein